MPGGTCHVGEDGWAAAVRETTEEIGDFPPPSPITGTLHHVEDDGKTQVYLCLCDVPYVRPDPQRGHPRGDHGRRRGSAARKSATWTWRPSSGTTGSTASLPAGRRDHQVPPADRERERRSLHPHGSLSAPPGGRLPLAIPAQGRRHGRAGGCAWGRSRRHCRVRWARPNRRTRSTTWPHRNRTTRWNHAAAMTGRCPRAGASRTLPPHGSRTRAASMTTCGRMPQATLTPAATSVGAPKSGGNDSGHPVVGSVPAKTPKPMRPHAVEPEVYDPAEAVEDWSPEAGLRCRPRARARSTSPTPTPSNGATSRQSWSPTSRTPRSNGSSTPHGTGRSMFPGPALMTTTSTRGPPRTRKRRLTGSPGRSPGAASTPTRRSSSTRRTAPTAAKRSSTGITGRWRGTSSSASRSSPTSGPSRQRWMQQALETHSQSDCIRVPTPRTRGAADLSGSPAPVLDPRGASGADAVRPGREDQVGRAGRLVPVR